MINITTPSQITKIYLVTNCYDDPNKVYIGKEKYPKPISRESCHKRTYGKQIIFTYIDEINSLNSEDWKPLECYWIEQFKHWGFNVQNKNNGGGGNSLFSEERRIKMMKPVLQYDLQGNFIQEWIGASIAAEKLKCNRVGIVSCCIGKSKYSGDFIWFYKNGEIKDKIIPNLKNLKTINQYKNGKFIKEWDINSLLDSDFNRNDIYHCCINKQKSHKGYEWAYKL